MKNNLLSEKLVYTGDARTPTHLHLVRYTPDEVYEYTADNLPQLEPQFSEKEMIWLQVHGLKETETVRQICDRFGIDFLVMQDILNADHPTKVEEHERYMLVVAKFFRGEEEMQVCLVQGADFVLTFIESESPLFDDIPQAIRGNVLKFRTRSSDYLLSVLLNSVTANYATLISKLDRDLDDLETGLLATTDCRDTGSQIQELRHRYLQLKQAALPLRDQYAKLLHSDSELLHENVRPFFNDVNDHLQYVVQQIDLCRETLSSLVDLYISNNDLRMNAIMKRLTIVSTIFIPLTFLVGVWGMNFRRMPELEWEYGYAAAWAAMLLIGVVVYLIFRKKEWR